VQWFAARLPGRAGWEQVSRQDIQQWLAWLLDRYSNAYASNQYRALQQFFKWLAAEDELPDPMAGLQPPRVTDKLVPVFTGEELTRLDHACAGRSFAQRRDTAIIAVAAIRVICQPAMPPVLITWTVAARAGAMGTASPSPIGIGFATAAVAAAADASRPATAAAKTVASRPRRAPAVQAASQWRDRGWWKRCVLMIVVLSTVGSGRLSRPCTGRLAGPGHAPGTGRPTPLHGWQRHGVR
jgi:hypothetical protein